MSKLLVNKRKDGVLELVLNRPEVRNAIDYELMDLLAEALTAAETDRDIKVVKITGNGNAFCSGGDLSVFHSLYTKDEAFRMLSKMGDVLYKLFTFPKPTAAVIQGNAVGGGCELAAACDVRIAADHVKLGFVQGKLGITTGWGGSTILFERIRHEQAFELLMNAEIYRAQRCLELGFIEKVVPLAELEDAFARWSSPKLALSAEVLSAYKQHAVARWEEPAFKKRFANEIERCAMLWESEEHHQAVAQFLNRANK